MGSGPAKPVRVTQQFWILYWSWATWFWRNFEKIINFNFCQKMGVVLPRPSGWPNLFGNIFLFFLIISYMIYIRNFDFKLKTENIPINIYTFISSKNNWNLLDFRSPYLFLFFYKTKSKWSLKKRVKWLIWILIAARSWQWAVVARNKQNFTFIRFNADTVKEHTLTWIIFILPPWRVTELVN